MNDPEALASQVIIDILNHEMSMPENTVWLREQDRTIPNDNGLYMCVGLTSARSIGIVAETFQKIDPDTNILTFYETDNVQQQEAIQIDIMSSPTQSLAMKRNWEILAALGSIYSKQQQEKSNFKICRIPRNFADTSSAEGGSMLQRYSITIICLVWYRKTKQVDYFDDFTVKVNDDKSIETDTPIIEFEIDPETPRPPLGD